MNLLSVNEIKALLSKYETKPSKGLGQNFLIDKATLDKIIQAADINPSDFILEVGPGLGTLTQELAKKAGEVVAVEKDETMIKVLKETLKDFNNIKVIHGDILKNKLELPKKYKLVANIPYYLTSPLIRKFLESDNPPEEIILMLQKEVAQRVCSISPNMSLLAVSVQFYAEAKIISTVSKNCFWPSPKIDSAIIKITPYRQNGRSSLLTDKTFIDKFFKIVKAGFSQPRKQLAGNLSKIMEIDRKKTDEWLLKNNIKPTQRAETLSVNDWKNLTNDYKK